MPLLSDVDRKTLEDRFGDTLDQDVKIRLFTQSQVRSMLTIPGQPSGAAAGDYAQVTQELLQELVETSPKLSLEVLDVHGPGAEEARRLGIEQIPAIVLGDDEGGRVRFYGAPVGNEFPTILTGIEALSTSQPVVREGVKKVVRDAIDEQVHLRVFVTPT
jgi:alkyl hydroperoxide reductase subunit AhpF